MQGVYTLSKPNINSPNLVVVDVDIRKFGFCDSENGLDMRVNPYYSVLLKEHMCEKSFLEFAEEMNQALSKTHGKGLPIPLKVIETLLMCPLVLFCMVAGEANLVAACEKSGRDRTTDKALAEAYAVVEKWNGRFKADDIPCVMRLRCLRRHQDAVATNLTASPGMNRGADWRELAQVNDAIWVEIELGSIHNHNNSKAQETVAAA
jgi:hypothetical protein